MKIFPSLISSNLLNLGHTIELLDGVADGYHLDVMDDHFVPNLTWGPDFINSIANVSSLPLHVHLMVQKPQDWVKRLTLRPKDTLIFHCEAVSDRALQKSLLKTIRDQGLHVGVAINPTTAIDKISDILSDLDMVLIMSVQPGFSGQTFMTEVTKKIGPLVQARSQQKATFTISMDGGINATNLANLAACGVDSIAAAAAIFHQPDPVKALRQLYELVNK